MKDKIINALQKTKAKGLPRNDLWKRLKVTGNNEEYWTAEQSLVDEKKVERRRGRRGGIYLISDRPDTAAESPEDRMERGHYAKLLRQIETHWTEQPGLKHVFAAVTALQGRRATGGRWTRPDLVICTITEWVFSSRPEADVRTIEVKRFEALDVMGVYEALSHKSRSHYSYLLIVDYPSELTPDQHSTMDAVLGAAGQNGVGVITVEDSDDFSTWDFQLDPSRSSADNAAVNQLLLDQFPQDKREAFVRALRTVVHR